LPVKESAHRAGKTGLLLVGAEGFGEIFDLDDRHKSAAKKHKNHEKENVI
jgi:hypothetical protein